MKRGLMDQGTLNWSLPATIEALGRLPVRLLTEDGRVAAAGLSGRDIQVPAGTYLLSCILPSGREIVRRKPIEIKPGVRTDPRFRFLEFDLTPVVTDAARGLAADGAKGLFGFVRALTLRLLGRATADGASRTEARMCEGEWMAQPDIATGPPADGTPVGAFTAAGALSTEGGPQRISRSRGTSADRLIEVEAAGARHFFVVPFDWAIGGSDDPAILIRLRAGEDGVPKPHFTSPVSGGANTLLEFVRNGLLDHALALSSDLLGSRGDARPDKGISALQCVLAGYVLLRANALEGIEARIEQLAPLREQIPDVRIIEAEMLSRLGEHKRAVETLRAVVSGRCPWFRSGISYALERLRLYVEVDAETSAEFNLSAADRELFVHWRWYFGAMGRRLDVSSLMTAFTYPVAGPQQAQAEASMAETGSAMEWARAAPA